MENKTLNKFLKLEIENIGDNISENLTINFIKPKPTLLGKKLYKNYLKRVNKYYFNKRYEEVNIKLYYDNDESCFIAISKELPGVGACEDTPIKTLKLFTEFYKEFLKHEKVDKISSISKRKIKGNNDQL